MYKGKEERRAGSPWGDGRGGVKASRRGRVQGTGRV